MKVLSLSPHMDDLDGAGRALRVERPDVFGENKLRGGTRKIYACSRTAESRAKPDLAEPHKQGPCNIYMESAVKRGKFGSFQSNCMC